MQAYVLGFDVYVYNVTSEELVPITTDGRENEVYNSIPDWMYEGTVLTTLFIFHAVSFVQNKYASRLPIFTVNYNTIRMYELMPGIFKYIC